MTPARKPLPLELSQRAFSTQEAQSYGVGRSRLRTSQLLHPYRGMHVSAEMVGGDGHLPDRAEAAYRATS